MPYTPSDAAIVTPEDVLAAQKGGARVELPRDRDAIGALIEAASYEVAAYLDRTLYAHEATARWVYDAYGRYDDAPYYARVVAPHHGLPEDVAAFAESDAIVTAEDADTSVRLDYRSGYRRADQSAGAFATAPLYPADLTGFVCDLVLYRWNAAQTGVGITDTEVDTGSGIVRRRGVRTDWFSENRHRIARYRHVAP